jgi:uncharacterized protein YcaQ
MPKADLLPIRKLVLQNYLNLKRKHHSVPEVLTAVGYIQIDTISRVQRAHHHSLWNRLPQYSPEDLQRAQNQGSVFEYWSHAAAYLPWEAYRFCLHRMRRIQKHRWEWFPEKDKKVIRRVMDRIRSEGPLQSSNFKDPRHKSGGWWEWKPAKMALEQLFQEGKLMVKTRQGFQKVFDLPERVLPSDINTKSPTTGEIADYLIDLTLRNQGISRLPYLKGQQKDGTGAMERAIKRQLKEGSLVPVEIEEQGKWYCRPEFTAKLKDGTVEIKTPEVRLLSPFDNLIIQRNWTEDILGFPYRLECYLPEQKRRYGYFTLPILSSIGFLGLLEAKALRKEGILQIESFHPEVEPRALLETVDWELWGPALDEELTTFAEFNQCPEVVWSAKALATRKW